MGWLDGTKHRQKAEGPERLAIRRPSGYCAHDLCEIRWRRPWWQPSVFVERPHQPVWALGETERGVEGKRVLAGRPGT